MALLVAEKSAKIGTHKNYSFIIDKLSKIKFCFGSK